MVQQGKTVIRVQLGADNCRVEGCTAYIAENSNRSLVDTSAKNTEVVNSKVIEISGKLKRIGKITFLITIVGFIADMITLITTGNHLFYYIIK
jgi:hypothetical protein